MNCLARDGPELEVIGFSGRFEIISNPYYSSEARIFLLRASVMRWRQHTEYCPRMKDKPEFLYCVFIVAAAIFSAVARCSFTRPDQLGRNSRD